MYLLKLFVAHFFADFVLQNRVIANGKGRAWRYWLLHVALLTLTTGVLFFRQVTHIWPMLSTTILLHALIDLCSSRLLKPSWAVLVADQLLHWASLPIILAVFNFLPWRRVQEALKLVDDPTAMTLALGYSFSLFFGSVLVERICDRFDLASGSAPEDPLAVERERAASTFIGLVERFLVTTFIFFGQYGAVGYVFAAKSLGKFTEGSDNALRKRFPAYYLVGTLASLAVAVLAGLFLRWRLQGTIM